MFVLLHICNISIKLNWEFGLVFHILYFIYSIFIISVCIIRKIIFYFIISDQQNFARHFATGYLIGEVLHKYQLQDDFDQFSQSK